MQLWTRLNGWAKINVHATDWRYERRCCSPPLVSVENVCNCNFGHWFTCAVDTSKQRGQMSMNGYSSSSLTTPASSKSSGSSVKRLFTKRSTRSRRAELTINARPFSATHSPYEEKVAAPGHRRRNASAGKANSVRWETFRHSHDGTCSVLRTSSAFSVLEEFNH